MNKIYTKHHALYGQVQFILDYDNKYKPLAKDVFNVINNTAIEYTNSTLLEKRDVYNLIESNNDSSMFAEWICDIYDKLNTSNKTALSFKDEAEILNTVTIDDFAIIDIHPFSCNNMYEAKHDKTVRTTKYNNWWDNFPTHELIKFKDVDFNKPVFVWYHFKCIDSYDIENLLKPTSDKVCDFLATTDKNFKFFRVDGEYVDKYNDGKIYIFICNVEEKTSIFK